MVNTVETDGQRNLANLLENQVQRLRLLPDITENLRSRIDQVLAGNLTDISAQITALQSLIGAIARERFATGDVIQLRGIKPAAVIGIEGNMIDIVIRRGNGVIQRNGDGNFIDTDIIESKKYSEEDVERNPDFQKMRVAACRWKIIKIAEQKIWTHSKELRFKTNPFPKKTDFRSAAKKIAESLIQNDTQAMPHIDSDEIEKRVLEYFE